jgi:UDP-galactopyranose mutase
MAASVLVVGCGFAGAASARILADAGHKVTIHEARRHVAGNAFDRLDDNGVMIHEYGPHIFHTNSKKVFEFLSRFTHWRLYEHRVLASVGGQLLPFPINRTTINRLYGLDLDEAGVLAHLERVREPATEVKTSADLVLGTVGRDLCDRFYRGYTRKQWGLELEQLSVGVAARIPTRTNDDDRYFTDSFQFMPADGYTKLFENMLAHDNIEVNLGRPFHRGSDEAGYDRIIYTGPIDAYFGHELGRLPYRSLKFRHEHLPHQAAFQPTGTVNYPLDHDYTRVTEFKHLTGQACSGTSVVYEYPCADGPPYYPIPRPENEALFKRYQSMADALAPRVLFVGRLAQYRYYNMDQVVAAAMTGASSLLDGLQQQ